MTRTSERPSALAARVAFLDAGGFPPGGRQTARADALATAPSSWSILAFRSFFLDPFENRPHRVAGPRRLFVPPTTEARGFDAQHDSSARLTNLQVGPCRQSPCRALFVADRRAFPTSRLFPQGREFACCRGVIPQRKGTPGKTPHDFFLLEALDENVEQ